MPDVAVPERDYHSPGDFADVSLERVEQRLRAYPFVQFHPGLMPQTFECVADVGSYSLVHVDVDVYPSVLECCKWFWPRLCRGGVMIFDDYGFRPYRYAARVAVDEFFAEVLEQPIAMPTGQAIALKL